MLRGGTARKAKRDMLVRIKGIITVGSRTKNTRSYGHEEREEHVRYPKWDSERIETAPYKGTETERGLPPL